MPWLDNFRQNITRTIESNGISQSELARRSGVHFVTINRILNGHGEPSVSTAERLAIAAGMTAESAFREIPKKSSKESLTTI